jgi:hypothetical protein
MRCSGEADDGPGRGCRAPRDGEAIADGATVVSDTVSDGVTAVGEGISDAADAASEYVDELFE